MAARNSLATADDRTLVIERVFDAPVDLVWKCWTEPQHLTQWSAPRGFTIPHSEGDLRPGGKWRVQMRSPAGNDLWLGGVYREIVENKRLVMTNAWEEDGTPGHETLVTVRFEELGGKTQVTLHQAPFDSVETRDGHSRGWNACLDILAERLAKTPA